MNNRTSFAPFFVVGAIGVLVIFAAFFTSIKDFSPLLETLRLSKGSPQTEDPLSLMRLVENRDHRIGREDAPVTLVEYADTECPFSKHFQQTMNRVMDTYGNNGDVAWVYRHFPNDAIHSKARTEARALECAQEIGGGYKFWEYLNRIFSITPSNNGLNLAALPAIAHEIGLNQTLFDECMQSERHNSRIQTDFMEAVRIGGEGTPHTILIGPDGSRTAIIGDIPFEELSGYIDRALAKNKFPIEE